MLSVKVESVISKPLSEIFNAIKDPEKMNKYFISQSDHPLEEGKKIIWKFSETPDQFEITVKKIITGSFICFLWTASGAETEVKIYLEATTEQSTKIRIHENEWPVNDEGAQKAMLQTEGWTDFLCCLKAFLLFNVDLRRGIYL